MNTTRLLTALLLAGLFAGCADLELTSPNERTSDTFWQTEADAIQGINATYNALQANGGYGRWLVFAYDLRSDIGLSRSPWTDLANFTKTVLGSYDFEVNIQLWRHHYEAIFRANQVIAQVPEIDMDAALRDRIVAEARFIRGLMYFNLAVLYENVPLMVETSTPDMRPPTAPVSELWAQIESDFTAAASVLPATYSGNDVGRATSGAALAMLAKAHLQQREFDEAIDRFEDVLASPAGYDLLPNFADNFVESNDNSVESIFEVQFAGPEYLSLGTRGQNIPRMIGPCGVGFCDGQPTEWYFQQFFVEPTESGDVDPRLHATIFWNDPDGMDVYGVPFATRYPNGDKGLPIDETYFWKKYGEHYLGFQDWDAAINIKVVRLGGLLLNYAEALNEANRTAEAYTPVDRVRTRAGLAPLAGGLTQAEMRDEIEHQVLLELALEGERWLYLRRQGLLDPATLPDLLSHDPDFEFFVDGKSELLPIPQAEVDLNPNASQNPGW